MKINSEKSAGRREFLKNGLRTFLLGGIIYVSGFLGWREICSAEDENLYTIKLPCRDCSKYTDCTYPIAVELKQNIPSNSRG